jgi:AcrR family transcriptional regulator
MSVKPRREEHTEATRAALLDAAAGAFAAQGFARTSVEDIARSARLTKGALYHHWKDKTALFEAVFRRIEEALVRRVVEASARHADPWARVEAGFAAMLEAALEPENRRIVFEEAPVALGWTRWRAIEEEHMMGVLRESLRALHDAGLIRAEPLDLVAPVLFSAIAEACQVAARARDTNAAQRAAQRLMLQLVRGLAPERPGLSPHGPRRH